MGEIIVVRPGTALWRSATARGARVDRVDLSQVVSPHVRETDTNLRRLFDRAERSGSVLLFDEGDALMGRRGAVADAGGRYDDPPRLTEEECAQAVARLRRRRPRITP